MSENTNMTEEKKSKKLSLKPIAQNLKKPMVITIGIIVIVILAAGGASYAWAQTYYGKIAPNIYIGSIDVSGLEPEMARQKVQKRADEIIEQGMPVTFNNETKDLPLTTIAGPDSLDDVEIDIENAISQATQKWHSDNPAINTLLLLSSLVGKEDYPVSVRINDENILTSLQRVFPDNEKPAIDAGFEISKNDKDDDWQIDITKSQQGEEFEFAPFKKSLTDKLEKLQTSSITLTLAISKPKVVKEDIGELQKTALQVLNTAPYTLTYKPNHLPEMSWKITDEDLANMLSVSSSEKDFVLSVTEEGLDALLEKITPEVEVEAQNARFAVEDGVVVEFAGSKPGVSIDKVGTKRAIELVLNNQTDPDQKTSDKEEEKTDDAESDSIEEDQKEDKNYITLAVKETDPEISTAEVNDLGITEILGVGISDFSGSPSNRRKNIRNGVNLLNGRLIAPGEDFSLIKALSPFTYTNGYLPELVIKGDKIEPEVGGGLCQIGTTTFRATMNSGLKVTNRRNHSLVVSYYNDPANGNPGTDATIYDPAPDYIFTNDTDNYILFQAEMLDDKSELRFTFWGTSDGRKGSYTPPVVHRWIGTGPMKEIVSKDLAPGARKCQGAHVGADTSFTYTVERVDGSIEKEVFESHYRPLPTICLVGAEDETNSESTGGETDTNDETISDTNIELETVSQTENIEDEAL